MRPPLAARVLEPRPDHPTLTMGWRHPPPPVRPQLAARVLNPVAGRPLVHDHDSAVGGGGGDLGEGCPGGGVPWQLGPDGGSSFSRFVDPGRSIDPFISGLTGIDGEVLRAHGATGFGEAWAAFHAWLQVQRLRLQLWLLLLLLRRRRRRRRLLGAQARFLVP